MTDALLARATRAVDRGSSRRGFLGRLALVGTALAVGPVRYLVRPDPALALITCRSCRGGAACCDGWTTFCCTLTGENACPDYSYAAGWWKCTSYTGSRYCEESGVRYYVDCNLRPPRRCPGGCGCANDKCDNRRTCCVNFRYGNCRTDVRSVTPVVCRVVLCRNPCRVEAYDHCSCSGPVDNRVCAHEAGCLPADLDDRPRRPERRLPARSRRPAPRPEPEPEPEEQPLPRVVLPPEIQHPLPGPPAG